MQAKYYCIKLYGATRMLYGKSIFINSLLLPAFVGIPPPGRGNIYNIGFVPAFINMVGNGFGTIVAYFGLATVTAGNEGNLFYRHSYFDILLKILENANTKKRKKQANRAKTSLFF
jgi:hypothetical protein